MTQKHPSYTTLLILLIAIASPLAGNLYLPSLPALSGHFHTSDDTIELTITSFLLGFGVLQLIYGPLSDRFGRRKILFIGMGIALIGSMSCILAKTVAEFIFARFILGAGVAVSSALGRSVLRDLFNGETLVKVATRIFTILSIAPLMATLLGSYIESWYGWQMTFLFLCIFIILDCCVVWKFFGESNQNLQLAAIEPKQLLQDYWYVLSHPIFLGNTLSAAFAIAAITVYSTLSPFLFQEKLGLSVVEYGWISVFIASGIIIGRIGNNFLLRYFSNQQIMFLGQILMLGTGILLLLLHPFHMNTLPMISFFLLLFLVGTALMIPFASLRSLEPFPNNAGLVGGLYGAITLLISCIASFIVATLRDNFLPLIGSVYIILTLSSMLALYYTQRATAKALELG